MPTCALCVGCREHSLGRGRCWKNGSSGSAARSKRGSLGLHEVRVIRDCAMGQSDVVAGQTMRIKAAL